MRKHFNRMKNRIRRKKKRAAPKKKLCFDYQALPTVMKRCVLDFLPAEDIITLTQTCKGMESELGLSRATQPVVGESSPLNISVMTFSRMISPLSPVAAIVPTEPEKIQSVSFQCDWMDQGIGETKGKLYVVAQKKSLLHDETDSTRSLQSIPFAQGRFVCGPSCAGHNMSNLSVTFYAEPNEFYQIWCFVGDCNGYMLHFKNMRFNILRYGEKAKNPYPMLRYRFSYEEDEETHMKRMSVRRMDNIVKIRFVLGLLGWADR